MIVAIIIILVIILSVVAFYSFANDEVDSDETSSDKDYIKWVDFNVTTEAMKLTSKLDIESHNSDAEVKYNWIELLSYLAAQNGGNFKNFKKSDLDNLVAKLDSGEQMSDLTSDMKFYDYYYEAYSAVLSGFIGNYSIEIDNSTNIGSTVSDENTDINDINEKDTSRCKK